MRKNYMEIRDAYARIVEIDEDIAKREAKVEKELVILGRLRHQRRMVRDEIRAYELERWEPRVRTLAIKSL